MEANMSYEEMGVMKIGRILLGLDLHEGIMEKMLIHRGPITHIQMLDYMGISVRCLRFHRCRYLMVECTLNINKKVWVKKPKHTIIDEVVKNSQQFIRGWVFLYGN